MGSIPAGIKDIYNLVRRGLGLGTSGRGCGCEQQDQRHDMTKYEYLFCPLAVLSLS